MYCLDENAQTEALAQVVLYQYSELRQENSTECAQGFMLLELHSSLLGGSSFADGDG